MNKNYLKILWKKLIKKNIFNIWNNTKYFIKFNVFKILNQFYLNFFSVAGASSKSPPYRFKVLNLIIIYIYLRLSLFELDVTFSVKWTSIILSKPTSFLRLLITPFTSFRWFQESYSFLNVWLALLSYCSIFWLA